MSALITVIANAVGLWAAVLVVPGVGTGDGDTAQRVVTLLVVGAILGVVNAVVRPLVKLLSLPLYLLTLGLFALVVNALMLLLTEQIAGHTPLVFTVDGFWAAVLAGLVVAVVGAVAGGLLRAVTDAD